MKNLLFLGALSGLMATSSVAHAYDYLNCAQMQHTSPVYGINITPDASPVVATLSANWATVATLTCLDTLTPNLHCTSDDGSISVRSSSDGVLRVSRNGQPLATLVCRPMTANN